MKIIKVTDPNYGRVLNNNNLMETVMHSINRIQLQILVQLHIDRHFDESQTCLKYHDLQDALKPLENWVKENLYKLLRNNENLC